MRWVDANIIDTSVPQINFYIILQIYLYIFYKVAIATTITTTPGGQEKPYPVRKPGSGQDVVVSPDRTQRSLTKTNSVSCNVREDDNLPALGFYNNLTNYHNN